MDNVNGARNPPFPRHHPGIPERRTTAGARGSEARARPMRPNKVRAKGDGDGVSDNYQPFEGDRATGTDVHKEVK